MLPQPWHVRMARWLRRQRAESMAVPNMPARRDPEDRPINWHRVYFVVIVFTAAIFLYVGQAVERRYQRAMPGLYRPAPVTSYRLDCTPEGRESCKAQARLGAVK